MCAPSKQYNVLITVTTELRRLTSTTALTQQTPDQHSKADLSKRRTYFYGERSILN